MIYWDLFLTLFVYMVASKRIKQGWRPKCLARFGCSPGLLVIPMEVDALRRDMWCILQKHGIDEKKLAVFKPEDSGDIASRSDL